MQHHQAYPGHEAFQHHGVQQYHDYQYQQGYQQQAYMQPGYQQQAHHPHPGYPPSAAQPPSYPAPAQPPPAYQPPPPSYPGAQQSSHWQQQQPATGWQQQGAAAQPPAYNPNMTAQSGTYPVALPPMDAEQRSTIDKTSGYCARNGQAFENMIREREGANPKFSFLHNQGEGNAYFRWRVHCMAQGLEQPAMDAILQEAFPHPTATAQEEFSGLLDNLSGSKDNIRTLRSWIMNHEKCMDWVCEAIRHRCLALTEFAARLHLVYVINDVLHACLKRRDPAATAASDSSSSKIAQHVARFLPTVFQQAGAGENQAKVTKVVGLWKDRGIFEAQEVTVDMSTLASFQLAIQAVAPQAPHPPPSAPAPAPPAPHPAPSHPAPAPPVADHSHAQPPPPYSGPQPMDFQMQPPAYPHADPAASQPPPHYGQPPLPLAATPAMPLPGVMAGVARPALQPAVAAAVAAAKPAWSTPDEMPPGLVVHVANLMRMGGSPAYTPIPPQICPPTAPPMAPVTPQLSASIDKFYAEGSVEKLLREHKAKKEQEAAEAAAKQRAQEEEESARRAKAAASTAPVDAAASSGVAGAARSAVNWCTPRKIVPKVSNQIVGLKKAKREDDDDDDVADVFKV